MQRCWNRPLGKGVFMDDGIDLFRGHSRTDFTGYQIQYSRVDFACFPNAVDLFFIFNHVPPGNDFMFAAVAIEFLVKRLVALPIRFAALTPAWFIYLHVIRLLPCSFCRQSTTLYGKIQSPLLYDQRCAYAIIT